MLQILSKMRKDPRFYTVLVITLGNRKNKQQTQYKYRIVLLPHNFRH